MATPLSKWARHANSIFSGIPDRVMAEKVLMRDPIRPIRTDSGLIFSPADGIVIHNAVVRSDELIEVKGTHFTVSSLFEGRPPTASYYYVCGIFMTYYDVHVNKAPVTGLMSVWELPPVATRNKPMLFTEEALMKSDFRKALKVSTYQGRNARAIYRFFMADGREVYVIAIADSEVNVIAPFTVRRNSLVHQNFRFGLVRWGSQVEVVIPMDEPIVRPLVDVEWHVEGGVDPLAEWVAEWQS